MALEKVFQELVGHLGKLHETFVELRLTFGDKPPRDEVVLVDRLSDHLDDLFGWLEGAVTAAGNARKAVHPPVDLDCARRELTSCQECFQRLAQQYSTDLVSYERIADLTRFARQRGGEWRRWAETFREAIERCRQPLQDTYQVLFQCWQELSERLGVTSVSVQNTNIGQQITAPNLVGSEPSRDGIT
jgi:hypothetical protein